MPSRSLYPYTWDPGAARYRDARGRFVAWSDVRAALVAAEEDAAANVRALTQQLREGAISLRSWQRGMAEEVRAVHLAEAALAAGGFPRMGPAEYGRVGGQVRSELAFLRRFAADVAAGRQRLDGTLLRRAEQYVLAGRNTYDRARRAEAARLGYDEERNVLHARESCHSDPASGRPGCAELTALGWVPVGTLAPIGARRCLRHCRCEIQFRRSSDGATMEG